jgi:ribosome-binding protein aMBF1 (putative translation factor)
LQQDITDEQLAEHIDLMVNIIDEVASLQEESEDVEASELEDIDEDQIEEATYGGPKKPGSKKPARFGPARGSAKMPEPPKKPGAGAPGSKTGGKS